MKKISRIGLGTWVHLFICLYMFWRSLWLHRSLRGCSPQTPGDGTSRYKAGQTRKINTTHHKEHNKIISSYTKPATAITPDPSSRYKLIRFLRAYRDWTQYVVNEIWSLSYILSMKELHHRFYKILRE